jgi:ubiquinone/menaquinone biosynthesis C-methylase UbiE
MVFLTAISLNFRRMVKMREDLLKIHSFPTLTHAFMNIVRDRPIEKKILDCGAGGGRPPTALFSYYGYETHGIDIHNERLRMAEDFCKENDIEVQFRQGDMRDLPYEDNSFGLVFSYNTICHLSKIDTKVAMDEMVRVLILEGFLFVNFLSVEDFRYGRGTEIAPNEFLDRARHTFFEDDEPDFFFEDTEIQWKLKWVEEFPRNGTWIKSATLAYLAKKR